jgi:hypothetical protein
MTELQKDVQKITAAIEDLYLNYSDEDLLKPLKTIRYMVKEFRRLAKARVETDTQLRGRKDRI